MPNVACDSILLCCCDDAVDVYTEADAVLVAADCEKEVSCDAVVAWDKLSVAIDLPRDIGPSYIELE